MNGCAAADAVHQAVGQRIVNALMIPCLCVKVAEGLGRAVVGVCEDRTRLDCLADGAGAGLFAVFEAGGLLRDGPVAEAVALGRDDLGGDGLAAVLADDGLAAVLGAVLM